MKSLFSVCVITLVLSLSCKTARYEFTGARAGAVQSGGGDGAVAAPGTPASPVAVDAPGGSAGPEESPPAANLPPTARIEVREGTQVVTSAKTQTPLMVGPSADSVDTDNPPNTSCLNVGIVKAVYDFGEGTPKTVERAAGACTSLETPHSYPSSGKFLIKMILTSDEGEEASASMTFEIHPGQISTPGTESSFTSTAVPSLLQVDEVTTVSGECRTPNQNRIAWDFGDSSTGAGASATHKYSNPGQYKILGKCTDSATGLEIQSSVTIVVMTPSGSGGTGSGGTGSGGTGSGGTGSGGTGSGGTGTNPPGQNSPNQNTPSQGKK